MLWSSEQTCVNAFITDVLAVGCTVLLNAGYIVAIYFEFQLTWSLINIVIIKFYSPFILCCCLKKEGLLMHIGKHYEYERLCPKLDL